MRVRVAAVAVSLVALSSGVAFADRELRQPLAGSHGQVTDPVDAGNGFPGYADGIAATWGVGKPKGWMVHTLTLNAPIKDSRTPPVLYLSGVPGTQGYGFHVTDYGAGPVLENLYNGDEFPAKFEKVARDKWFAAFDPADIGNPERYRWQWSISKGLDYVPNQPKLRAIR